MCLRHKTGEEKYVNNTLFSKRSAFESSLFQDLGSKGREKQGQEKK